MATDALKERTIEIPVSVFADLKSCEVKINMIAEAVKNDDSTYGLNSETEKLIKLIVGEKGVKKNDAV